MNDRALRDLKRTDAWAKTLIAIALFFGVPLAVLALILAAL